MFFVTVIECKEKLGNPNWDSRTMGYYRNREKAVDAVTDNVLDIHEHSYNYAVVEEMDEGVYPMCKSEQWFKWEGDNETGKYVCVPQPEQFKGIINWSMG